MLGGLITRTQYNNGDFNNFTSTQVVRVKAIGFANSPSGNINWGVLIVMRYKCNDILYGSLQVFYNENDGFLYTRNKVETWNEWKMFEHV